jgi:hypothetical protein
MFDARYSILVEKAAAVSSNEHRESSIEYCPDFQGFFAQFASIHLLFAKFSQFLAQYSPRERRYE